MNEQYIYLGFQANTFFYLHVVTGSEFDAMLSGEVYNVMIHESRIRNSEDNVIIYELNPSGLFDIIIIQHEDKMQQMRFELDNLSTFFRPLISVERDRMFVICYNYDKGCFETYETHGNIVKSLLGVMPASDIQIQEVRNIISQKEITVKVCVDKEEDDESNEEV